MATYYKTGKTFTIAYDGRLDGKPKGSRGYIYGVRTRKLAEQAKADKDLGEQLYKIGRLHVQKNAASHAKAAESPIEDLILAFYRSIIAKGRQKQHAHQQAAHIRRLLKLAHIQSLNALEAEPIQSAARSLMDENDLGPRTANAAIKAARQFSTWLMKSNRIPHDVLHGKLETYNEAEDVRRARRAMSEEELAYLLAFVEKSPRFLRSRLTGEDRVMLYLTAIGTGFRRSACFSLTKSSFRVAENIARPAIILAAEWNKNGKERVQAIRRDLAALLHAWLATKPDAGPTWPVPPHAHLETLLRRDLGAARAAWIKEAKTTKERAKREESGFLAYERHDGAKKVYADFHSLRHTGITRVVRHAGLKVAQAWADHSTPVLTARYAHMDLPDEDKALEALPAADLHKPVKKQEKRIG